MDKFKFTHFLIHKYSMMEAIMKAEVHPIENPPTVFDMPV